MTTMEIPIPPPPPQPERQLEIDSKIGARGQKQIQEAIRSFHYEGKTTVEIFGVHGQPETERQYRTIQLFGGALCDNFREVLHAFYDSIGWKVAYGKVEAFCTGLAAATKQFNLHTVDKRITQEEAAEQNAAQAERSRIIQEKQERHLSITATLNRPAWAERIIIAELREDDSDSMTDYFAHKVTRRVAIGWGKTTRENFRELREAARQFGPTAHLADAEKVEHRDNYSGGLGNWLGEGYTHSSGWIVRSRSLAHGLPNDLDAAEIPEAPAVSAPAGRPVEGVDIRRNEKLDGLEVAFAEKPPVAVLEWLKTVGRFRWSRHSGCWYRRYTPEAEKAVREYLEGKNLAQN